MYLDANNLYGWAMSQKVPVKGFKWKRNVPKFNEKIIKNYDEDSKKESIFEADNEKVYMIYPVIYHFCLKEWKYKNAINLYEICMIKKNYVAHIRVLKQALNYGLVLK